MMALNKLNKGIKRTKKVVVRVYDIDDKLVDKYTFDMEPKTYDALFNVHPEAESIKIEQLNNHTKIIKR